MNQYETLTSGKFNLYSNPIINAAVVLALAIIAMLALRNVQPAIPWQISGISMLFFTVYSQVKGLFMRRFGLYMALCYGAFIMHTALLLFIAGGLADVPLAELPRFKKTYALLGIFFIMLSMLAGIYRVALYLLATPNTTNSYKRY